MSTNLTSSSFAVSKTSLPVVIVRFAMIGSSALAPAQDFIEGLEPLTVIGSRESAWQQVGSASYLEATEFRKRGYTDIAKILAPVPGVYVREEDGYGNFPNISIRGGDGTRAEKVTVMEDGILTAPAPYSAPAAYYFPKSGRMAGIEVLKGSSQVRYGPQTTGGVLNFLSTPVPGEGDVRFYSRTTGGSDNSFYNHSYYGDTLVGDGGRSGFLLEFQGQTTDGYREFLGPYGQDSGFRYWEPNLKMFWEIDGPVRQRFEVKLGMTDFLSDEGYLGLTESDARSRPDTRYGATQFDEMDSRQYRSYFKYLIEPTDDLSFESALYANSFERNWYKLDHVSSTVNPGIDSRGRISGGSGRTSLHQALLDPALVAVLQGTAPGSTGVKANARYYDAYGWQNQLTWRFDTGAVGHELVSGFRYHYDRAFREQWVDVFNGDGSFGFSPFRSGVAGDESNRLEESQAVALYLEDVIEIGRLTLRPGIRYEFIDFETTDFANRSSDGSDNFGVWGGGVGFNYAWDDCHSTYGGVYRGYSIPGPDSWINGEVREEESLGYELGWRYLGEGLRIDTAAFLTDFDHLISTGAGLANHRSFNAGAATVWGFESLIEYDAGLAHGLGFGLPVYLSATWTSAELEDALTSGGADNIYSGGQPGADIPYVPEWKLAAGIGYASECWGVNLDAYFTSHTYGTALNADVPVSSAREGKIDALLTVDLSGYYAFNDHWKLVGGLQNLFDERAVVTRLPEGPRTNLPRTWFAGLEVSF